MLNDPIHTSEGLLSHEIKMRAVMTPAPRTIEGERTIAEAHALMRSLRCRHLPVARNGKLIGVVSERDLYIAEALDSANRTVDAVSGAMTPYVYTTTADALLRDVARVMAAEKYGCAVVMDGAAIIGIFTATDAFQHLVARLG